jgi:membrane protease YdiL (CAAX protease family)
MNGAPIGALQALRALAWSACLRLLRQQQMATATRAERKGGATVKSTTRRRGGMGLALLFVVFVPVMGCNAMFQSALTATRMAAATQEARPEPAKAEWQPSEIEELLRKRARKRPRVEFELDLLAKADPQATEGDKDRLAAAAGLLLAALAFALVAGSIGATNLELGRAAWSFPWLFSFPAPTRAIVLAKVAEGALVQAFPWFLAFPTTWQLVRALGWDGPAWLVAVASTALLCSVIGGVRFLLETWLRLRLPVQRIRAVQGAGTLVSLVGLMLVMRVALAEETPAWFLEAAAASASLVHALPTSWPLAVARGDSGLATIGASALLAVPVFAILASVRLLRTGLDRGGERAPRRVTATNSAGEEFAPLGVLRKELLLLARDRSFLIQTVCVPIVVVVVQMTVTPAHRSDASGGGMSVVMCYFLSVMATSTGCFLVLSSEGKALWLTLAQPAGLAATLTSKVRLWSALGAALACGVFFVLALAKDRPIDAGLLFDIACLGVGAHGAAWLAASIGVLTVDPTADTIPRMPRPRHMYLFLFLSSTYVAGLASDAVPQRLAAMLVFSTLAWSMWQRANDRLPWLFDADSMPTARLSAYDAGAAVTTFLALQSLVAVICVAARARELATPLAFAIAGALTLAIWSAALAARGLSLLGIFGFDAEEAKAKGRGTLAGLLVGAALGFGAIAWLPFAVDLGLAPAETEAPRAQLVAFAWLAVVMAPLVEEPLFRGILLRALGRSTTPLVAAIWSSALFAVLHPVSGWLPVFALGLAAAILRQRTNWLPACIVAHAAYNAVVSLHALA